MVCKIKYKYLNLNYCKLKIMSGTSKDIILQPSQGSSRFAEDRKDDLNHKNAATSGVTLEDEVVSAGVGGESTGRNEAAAGVAATREETRDLNSSRRGASGDAISTVNPGTVNATLDHNHQYDIQMD